MPRHYLGFSRTKEYANLDALVAAIATAGCGLDTPPAVPTEGPSDGRAYFGHTAIKANADIDALWAMLPGGPPVPATIGDRIYVGRASSVANANLDAIYAALAPFDCCPPPACLKILDESFNFADQAAFEAKWSAVAYPDPAASFNSATLEAICDGETTQLMVKAGQPDQTRGNFSSTGFFSRVVPSALAPVWMRVQAYLDLMPGSSTLDNAQQQIAFGATNLGNPSLPGLTQPTEWTAFAVDTYVGGPFATLLTEWAGNGGSVNRFGDTYMKSAGFPATPPGPRPGAGVPGFAVEPYYDGFATLWEMVAHCQYGDGDGSNPTDGIIRIRTFIGPVGGPKVPMSDARIYAPQFVLAQDTFGLMELGWTVHSHKNAGVLRGPKLKRVEAWECSYAANPCAVAIVVPDPTGPVASLAIATPLILLDDTLEITEPVGVIARDADGVVIEGVRPEIDVINVSSPGDIFAFQQAVSCFDFDVTGDVVAFWPGGIVSPSQAIESYDGVTPHRYWKVQSDSPDNGRAFSLAALEFHETLGGPDVSGTGTPIGSAPLAGTALANLFDANAATFFTATGQPQMQHGGIDFGLGNEKYCAEVLLTARNDGQHGLAPAHFSIWSCANAADLAAGKWSRHQPYTRIQWTNGQTQTFNVN